MGTGLPFSQCPLQLSFRRASVCFSDFFLTTMAHYCHCFTTARGNPVWSFMHFEHRNWNYPRERKNRRKIKYQMTKILWISGHFVCLSSVQFRERKKMMTRRRWIGRFTINFHRKISDDTLIVRAFVASSLVAMMLRKLNSYGPLIRQGLLWWPFTPTQKDS